MFQIFIYYQNMYFVLWSYNNHCCIFVFVTLALESIFADGEMFVFDIGLYSTTVYMYIIMVI